MHGLTHFENRPGVVCHAVSNCHLLENDRPYFAHAGRAWSLMQHAILERSFDKRYASLIQKEIKSFASDRVGLCPSSLLKRLHLHTSMANETLSVRKLIRYKLLRSLDVPVAPDHA